MNHRRLLQFLDDYALALTWVGVGLVSAFWIGLAFWKYAHFLYDSLDLTIYAQVIWNTAHGRWFEMSIHPQSYLGDHFELYVLPLSLLYRLWSDPRLLLIIQVFMVTLSAIPFFLLARNYFRENLKIAWPSALALLLAYAMLLNPNVANTLMFEFHIIAFFLLPYAWSLYFAERGRFWPCLGFLFLTLLVREDAAAPVALAGLTAWILFPRVRQAGKWRWILTPLIASMIWFVGTTYIVSIFSPTGDYKFIGFLSPLAGSYPATITNLLLHPWPIVERIFKLTNLQTLIGLFVPMALLPFIGAEALIVAVPSFLQFSILNANSTQLLVLHYGLLFIPASILGTLFAFRRIHIYAQTNTLARRLGVPQAWPWHLAIIALLASPIYALATITQLSQYDFQNNEGKFSTYTEQAIREAISIVGDHDHMIVDRRILPRYANHEHLYPLLYIRRGRQQLSSLPYTVEDPINGLILDQLMDATVWAWQDGKAVKLPPRAAADNLRLFLEAHDLKPVWEKNGVAVFLPNAERETITLTAATQGLSTKQPFGDDAYLETAVTYTEPQTIRLTLALEPRQSFARPANFSIEFVNAEGTILGKRFLAPAWGLTTTDTWEPNQTVATFATFNLPNHTRTLQVTLSDNANDQDDSRGLLTKRVRLIPLPQ